MTAIDDVRHAVRSLVARPAFAVGAVASLAIGIGANATVFSIVSGLLIRPLPYHDPDRLVFVRAENVARGVTRAGVTLAEFRTIRDRQGSLRGASVVREGYFNLAGGVQPRRVRGAIVSPSIFATLGVAPLGGAAFTDGDDVRGAPPRVMISDALWQNELGSAADAVRRTLRVDGVTFEIAGVMPPGFQFPEQADLWIPVEAAANRSATDDNGRSWQLIARLASGATVGNARAELTKLGRSADLDRPAADRGWSLSVISADRERGENARPAVFVLLALVTCVLLVACANLAALLLVRAHGRRREMAIRGALGATSRQLVWHGLAESVVLAGVAGAMGLLMAFAGVRVVQFMFSDTLPFWLRFDVDWRVTAYALALSVTTTLAFGLAPAASAARRARATGWLHGASAGSGTAGGAHRGNLAGTLVAVQVAVSLVLLIAASVLGVALQSMGTTHLGYEPEGLITTELEPRSARYQRDDARRALFADVADRIRLLPGVAGVTGFDLWASAPVDIAGREGTALRRVEAPLYMVLPDYFATMRGRIIAGRPLMAGDDASSSAVAVVNETFARRFWPNESALGQRIRIAGGTGSQTWAIVVGIAGDIRRNPADPEREPHVYLPAMQATPPRLRLVIRPGAPLAAGVIEAAARAVDPDEPLGALMTMEEQIGQWTAPARFFASSLAGIAVVALLIAAAGVYSVVASVVVARTREFGVRLALGATPAHVVGAALTRGGRLAIIGTLIGLVLGAAVARVLVSLPFGVERVDARPIAVAACILIAVAASAAWVPARRAGRVDPTSALRHEP